MAGRIVLSALLAAVAIIIWGFIFWAALPFGAATLKTVPNEDALRSTLSQNLAESGAYLFPGMDPNAADKAAAEAAFRQKSLAGPRGLLLFMREGGEPMAPAQIVWGFVFSFVAALLMAGLLAMALPALPAYGERVLFVTLGGLFATIAVDTGYYNWWYFPLGFILAIGIFTVLAWFIAGLIMARTMGEVAPARTGLGLSDSSPRGGAYTFQPPVFARRRE
jgi:hypothetical protein